MADPPKRRVVTAQSSTPGSSTSSLHKIRAKVDPTAISTPTTSRPTLRHTPSSSSSLSSYTHLKSPPVPPLPTRTLSSTPTPSIRAKPTPLQRASTSTPTSSSTIPSVSRPTLSRPGSSAGYASPTSNPTFDRGRAKVKPNAISLSTPPHPPRSLSHSRPTTRQSTLPLPPKSAPMAQTPSQRSDTSSELTRVTSHHSSPGKTLTALPPHLRPSVGGGGGWVQHPTASCPPSPPKTTSPLLGNDGVGFGFGHGLGGGYGGGGGGRGKRSLPIYPNTQVKESRIDTPLSPEMRTVDLPLMTPRRSFDVSEEGGGMSREGSRQGMDGRLGGGGGGVGDGFRDRWSGSTAVEYEAEDGRLVEKITGLGIDQGDQDDQGTHESMEEEREGLDVEQEGEKIEGKGLTESQILDEDAEEAKINRKIADLEISNASLMAINRSLEAAKAKQRAEILKLRRALRESSDGHSHPPSFPSQTFRPLLSPSFTSPTPDIEDVDTSSDLEVELEDPELEDRWDKLQDLVLSMQKRADKAVQAGGEEVKVGMKVLDWSEVGGGDEEDGEVGDVSTDLTPADTRSGTPEG